MHIQWYQLRYITFAETDHEMVSTAILPPSAEKDSCQWLPKVLQNVLVNRLEDYAFPGKVQWILIVSTSLISNNRLSQSENLVPVLTLKSNNW